MLVFIYHSSCDSRDRHTVYSTHIQQLLLILISDIKLNIQNDIRPLQTAGKRDKLMGPGTEPT